MAQHLTSSHPVPRGHPRKAFTVFINRVSCARKLYHRGIKKRRVEEEEGEEEEEEQEEQEEEGKKKDQSANRDREWVSLRTADNSITRDDIEELRGR